MMRRWWIGTALGALLAGGAAAETLEDALIEAYTNNPTLVAQRAALRATDETLSQAVAGWRPTVRFTGDWGRGHTTQTTSQLRGPTDPNRRQLSATQPLYQGGRTVAQTRQAEANILAGRATLDSTEQTVLLGVVTSYMDVVRDQSTLVLRDNNTKVLRRQLEATKDRFAVGEVTRTDVSQAEARLSRAVADRTTAEGNLIQSRAAFQRAVGRAPGTLEPPPVATQLPSSETEAQGIAGELSPTLRAALYNEQAAGYAVDVSVATLLPDISIIGDVSRTSDQTVGGVNTTNESVIGRIVIPLYQSGSEWSAVRQAREVRSQRRVQIDEARRQVVEGVTRAWQSYTTATAQIAARLDQIRASEVALEGVRQEATVGSRTVLDVLDAEQELLDARVALVSAQRDQNVATYNVKSSIGRLTARDLSLPVALYDPAPHAEQVRGRWIGFSPAPD
jgi:TolC family type I secretion outer membrane protein